MATSSTSSTSALSGFNGQSQFASDLQNVITRAVDIAQLPITQLQNEESTLTNQQSELQTLGNDFEAVQSAIDSINSATGTGSYTATVSNTSAATATIGSNALPGTYAIDVTSLGTQTNTISNSSLPAVTDPTTGNISTSSAYTLTVDGKTYSLTPSGSSLNSLVTAINASGANVQATVVNVGGSTSPNYELSVQSTNYAPDTIQLNDGSQNLLTTLSTGSYVTYTVNGQPTTPINSSTRNLSISTGLTVDALQTGSFNVTVAAGTSSLSTALTSFATAYNAAVDELTKNRGQNGGALAGQSIVSELSSALQSLGGYVTSTSGTVNSLSDLGLTFDDNGHLNFDASTLSAASLTDVNTFLGSETTGGFLETAYNTLTALTDSTTGSISLASQAIGSSVTSLTSQISTKQDQVTQLQNSLTQQMAEADATISALESQVTEITNLFLAETQASKNLNG
jgi:flagellar hook-associated protein 2